VSAELQNVAYLIASVLFILGIKGMTHPRSAVGGNRLSAIGMLIAVIAVLLTRDAMFNWWVILAGLAAGGFVGMLLAARVRLTAMPQMVALLNGSGGFASAFVAMVAALHFEQAPASVSSNIATSLSGLIGALTFFGSLVAFVKLQELKRFKLDFRLPGQLAINAFLLLVSLGLAGTMLAVPERAEILFPILLVVASILGVMLVSPIGGADMPVVISLLNSYSGIAAAATGFIVENNVLIITGSLVGASGIILTKIMCDAMNRSLTNVLFGGISTTNAPKSDDVYAGKIKSAGPDEVGMILGDAMHVLIVPGYGLAVAQAQHAVGDLVDELEKRGVKVEFAIHPVAGRMPGHMNVLLAEVDIPYDKLLDLEASNAVMKSVDVAIVIGANDVVNPDARNNPSSPIAGMPVINVDQARTVVVIKRSLSPGFAGIPNPLFAAENTLMYFADGKKAVVDLVQAVRENAVNR
jgi:NAD(P) transhydrogenase subunit beta